ncbi:gliding motility-associated C-terminal domain-containing protein, partial [Bacteroidota bacterium]
LCNKLTHNRAGEITYKQLSELTYEITVITYTATGPGVVADRPNLDVKWGDGTLSGVKRIEAVKLPNYYKRNKYVWQHTYPGPGNYEIVVEDPNRNRDVNNIPNSVDVVFSIKTILMINPTIGYNSTPVLLNPPIDKAAVNHLFIHNPAAFDPDGDSLSYKLSICRGENGEEIPGYTLPPSSISFYVDEITGDMVWDSPTEIGVYNVAMAIEEWRNGIKIGEINRDMQIEVYETDNQPPQLDSIPPICVLAGEDISLRIRATDTENDSIKLSVQGGPIYLDEFPARFIITKNEPALSEALFVWNTKCIHIRKRPYQVLFKAEDNNADLNLVDYLSVDIKVNGPAPKFSNLTAGNNNMVLNWSPDSCGLAIAYLIYRSENKINFQPGGCPTGIPDSIGYERIARVDGYDNNSFVDNNNGLGLRQGVDYCYRIVSLYPDGATSYASEEFCATLKRGLPVITNVSVENTDFSDGSIRIAWLKPEEIDLNNAPGPYKYLIYRSEGMYGQNFSLIDSMPSINDTVYIDKNLNTLENQYSYKIEFYNVQENNRFLIGSPQIASSLFLSFDTFHSALKINLDCNVPWINEKFVIYKQNDNTGVFDSIAMVTENNFTDNGLTDGETYCYQAKSIGSFNSAGLPDDLINYSQENCDSPVDSIPPCPPLLDVTSVCDSLYNKLSWTNPNMDCANDVIGYRIYYSALLIGEMQLIDSVFPDDNLQYFHSPENTMAGCYAVTAIDSMKNESTKEKTCVDECINYRLPNVFSPNNDGLNDYFMPYPKYKVERVEFQVFDRWGKLVFETVDPDIKWDGKHYRTKKIVPTGVYYYICNVYEQRLTGLEPRYLVSFFHIFSDEVE